MPEKSEEALVNLSTPVKVLESESKVDDADVPDAPFIVIGEEPRTLNPVQETVPVQVTEVVATEPKRDG